MNLTPEERTAGRQGFRAALAAEKLDRRHFMKTGVAAGVVASGSMGAFYFGYEASVANPVRVGVLGTGDEGNVLIGAINPAYISVKAIADIRPYSVYRAFHGDHYSPAALKARCGLMSKFGWSTETEARKHVNVYGDYEELLKNEPDIDAVIIALPLHLHAPAAIAAMRAGKHVLTEKLMGHSVCECKEMARVAEQEKLHLATGHQRHYNILYQEAVDTIRRGVLGDLHYIRAQWHRGNMPGSDSWQKAMPESVKKDDPLAKKLQKELDSWNRRLKEAIKNGSAKEVLQWEQMVAQKKAQLTDSVLAETAEKHGYKKGTFPGPGGEDYDRPAAEELIRWRLWNRTGGGLMAELGSHQLDAASIFISAVHGEKKHPLNVSAIANRPLFLTGDREANDHVCCMFEFEALGYDAEDPVARRRKIGVQYASINGNAFGGYGEIVYGTEATLILEKEQEVMLFHKAGSSKIKTSGGGGPTMDTQASGEAQQAVASGPRNVSRGYAEELEHWAWCIRNPGPENKPRCHPKVAMADAVIALTTNMAAHKGQRVEFKDEWFDVHDDATPERDVMGENVKPDLTKYNK